MSPCLARYASVGHRASRVPLKRPGFKAAASERPSARLWNHSSGCRGAAPSTLGAGRSRRPSRRSPATRAMHSSPHARDRHVPRLRLDRDLPSAKLASACVNVPVRLRLDRDLPSAKLGRGAGDDRDQLRLDRDLPSAKLESRAATRLDQLRLDRDLPSAKLQCELTPWKQGVFFWPCRAENAPCHQRSTN